MNRKYGENYIKLGLNIAYYRKLNGLTQLQLAEAANISRTHLSNIEAPNSSTSISVDLIFEISSILKISPDVLFRFEH